MEELFNKTKERMDKSINALKSEYDSIRAGRANAKVLDKVYVDYYGTPTPINQMAAISVAEARVLVIQPWDKSTLKPIEKAIQASDVGINPQNDGNVIRLNFPALDGDRRKQLSRDVAKVAEESKIAIRQIRRDSIDALKKMKKDNEITEDDQKNGETKIQKITDDYTKKIDSIAEAKTEEIMSV
ncbi:MAG: ribosome recycling factor [Oscillospiraceae bacterium]|nr:ribosome recycling factor [Oscillospiraceae bacterium]MDD7354205.1 ribosome recycling factor [Oscillospiraceae bacterium]MDY3937286.1 ribosome recycling factor [Oscillospiraceae bacterium]